MLPWWLWLQAQYSCVFILWHLSVLDLLQCHPGMLWGQLTPGWGTKWWQLCSLLPERISSVPWPKPHHCTGVKTPINEGSNRDQSSFSFPILTLPETLLQWLDGLCSPGSSFSYSSPPGNPLPMGKTWLVLALVSFWGFSLVWLLVSSKQLTLHMVPIKFAWVPLRNGLFTHCNLTGVISAHFSPLLLPVPCQYEMLNLQVP